MMEDQLNWYVEYLNANGYSDCWKCNGRIYVRAQIESTEIVLKCDIETPFPYEFPQIYVDGESADVIRGIPHQFTDKTICLYDNGEAIANFFEPQNLLLEAIRKAEKIIYDGLNGNNKYDFVKEFTAYWNSKVFKAESFLTGHIQKAVWTISGNDNPNIIIAESEESLKHFVSTIWIKDEKEPFCYEALCVPIDGSKISKIPKTDVEVIKMITNCAYDATDYQRFMQKNLGKSKLIIMNIHMPNGNMTAGWLHYPAHTPNGFRKGKANLMVAYSNKETNSGEAIQINDCSQERLFNRGSDGEKAIWDNIAILGCGSVGSAVAELMMRLGITRYLLVDNQTLTIENIARHYCGHRFVGLNKTRAVKYALNHHNPNIHCVCVDENIHLFLNQKTEIFKNCELIVVSVGDVGVEHHIVECLNSGNIKTPVVILWMEPYGLGGHALCINKRQDLYEELFSKYDLRFQLGIVKNPEQYLKREAGCESSYMPYSGFTVSMFVHSVFDYIQSERVEKNKNYLITWVGKISEADKHGIEIADEYAEKKDFEILTKRVD